MPGSGQHARRAFTLLELILVLVVLGVLSALAAARLGGLRATQGVDQAAQQVLDQARRCQRLAVSGGEVVRLRLDLEGLTTLAEVLDPAGPRAPSDGHDPLVRLQEGVDQITADYRRDDGVALRGGQVDLLFLPDGLCEPSGLFTVAQLARGSQPRDAQPRQAAVRCHAGAQPPSPELLP